MVNNGHTIQVAYDPGSSLEIEGTRYQLIQFHFHTPSEHTFEGKHAPAELHLVHRSGDGRLAVIGVLLQPGQENAALAPLWQHLPAVEGPAQHSRCPDQRSGFSPGSTHELSLRGLAHHSALQ